MGLTRPARLVQSGGTGRSGTRTLRTDRQTDVRKSHLKFSIADGKVYYATLANKLLLATIDRVEIVDAVFVYRTSGACSTAHRSNRPDHWDGLC